MTIQMTALTALLLCVPLVADDVSDRAKLLGTGEQVLCLGVRLEVGQPKALFDSHIAGGFNDRFDLSKDGRFLVPTRAEQSSAETLTIVVNWPAELKK